MTAKNVISIVIEEPEWRRRDVELSRLRQAARLALLRGAHVLESVPLGLTKKKCHPRQSGDPGESDVHMSRNPASAGMTRFGDSLSLDRAVNVTQLTLLLSHDERLRSLNAQFRGKDAPTNVLAFSAAGPPDFYLGDVAVALGVAEREATRAGIGLYAHSLHLTVHGVLHLLGYDHVREGEARIMERLEIAILHELGLASPYARTAVE